MPRENKYEMYEESVQAPEHHAEIYEHIFTEQRQREPRSLREDFCGTFFMARTWVERGAGRTAVAIDLDPAPLRDGRKRHYAHMSPQARRRLRILRQDVRTVTTPTVDIVGAANFSFWVFKDWESLVTYFRCARRSLNREGVFILETAGGGGMVESTRETSSHRRNGSFWFKYIWCQRSFNPITHHIICTISFELRDGRVMKDAFVYDWRVWTLPEIERAMKEAGFSTVKHYWEGRGSQNGNGYAPYRLTQRGPNHHTWLSFIVGVR